jgi:choloylglycine hydrolase
MKKIFVLAILVISGAMALACSTFLLNKDGRYYFGKNYDWVTGNGMLMVNARHVSKVSLADPAFTWTAKYGSVTFNQYGKENPNGGMNEKGLVIELMWLSETEYPGADERPSLGVLQWIQYQLDNAATIDEVIASDKKVRISPETDAPQHYLVADATGKAVTIEFLDGKMVFHRSKDLPYAVLTNSTYASSLSKTEKMKNESFTDNSINRFVTACTMVQQYQQSGTALNGVDAAFSVLGAVAQGDFTKWSIVYDITGKKIHFFTQGQPLRRSVDLSGISFECSGQPVALELNSPGFGNLTKTFKHLGFEDNLRLIQTSVKQSGTALKISKKSVEQTAGIYHKTSCAGN